MEPNNKSTKSNPVGQFMVAAGGIIEYQKTGKILIIKRNSQLDWQPGEWEIMYGRLDQFESPEMGLKRETMEELGIMDLEVLEVITVWHMFRGYEKTEENELIGITYYCRTKTKEVRLSTEHQAYKWVEPKEALEHIKLKGIRKDVEKFIQRTSSK